MELISPTERGRYLIAIGCPSSPRLNAGYLKRVPTDVQRIVKLFTSKDQGYNHVLADRIPLGASAQRIKKELSAWFGNTERKASDCIVVYWAGHGDIVGQFGSHYLLAKRSTPRELALTAVETSSLVKIFFEAEEGERPQNILFLLDTCHAGEGGGQAASAVAQAKKAALTGEGAGFWVIASADSRTLAADGTHGPSFVDALLAVMEDDAWMPHGGKEFLNPSELKSAINDWFEDHEVEQRAEGDVVGDQHRPIFIRNPRFTRHLDGAELLDEGHWDPKARGVEGVTTPGWLFMGRQGALRELVAWLKAKTSDLKARVVTGQPGSGKSAVLARLVTSANPRIRAEMDKAMAIKDVSQDTLPEVGSIDACIHARGATVDQVASMLGKQLGVKHATVEGVLDELKERDKPARIVLDALDEANDPTALEKKLLEGLALCPAVRLIVGTRKLHEAVIPLMGVSKIIDLDKPPYFSMTDVQDYVISRLIHRVPPTIYAHPSRLIDVRRIAGVVARKAGCSFLYARIVSRGIGQETEPIDTSTADWEKRLQLPDDLSHLFGDDLNRFDVRTKNRVVDLLMPLAYARGKGLPQKNFWCALASKISGKNYHNRDIRDLKSKAGFYIIQDTDHGDVVYRLFHEEFAAYLKNLTRDEDIERVITDELISLVPQVAQENGILSRKEWRDWRLADSYIINNLAAHASSAGMLDTLVYDPSYLLYAESSRLIEEMQNVVSQEARMISTAYLQVSHHLRGIPREDAASYLELVALRNGCEDLANKITLLPFKRKWLVSWTRCFAPSSHRILLQNQFFFSLLVTSLHGRLVIVGGDYDGSVRIVDLVTGTHRGDPLIGHEGRVLAVAVGELDGEPVVVSAGYDAIILVHYLKDGSAYGKPLRGHKGVVNTIDVKVVRDRLIAVSGGDDGTIRMWDLKNGCQCGQPVKVRHGGVRAVAIVHLDGQPRIVSGGEDGKIYVWDVADHGCQGEPFTFRASDSRIYAIAIASVGQRQVVLSTGEAGTVDVWSLSDGARHAGPLTGHNTSIFTVSVAEIENQILAATAGHDGTVRIWDVAKGTAYGEPLIGHDRSADNVTWTNLNGRPVIISNGSDATTRVWDLPILGPHEDYAGHKGKVYAAALAELNGLLIVISGGEDRTLRMWDLSNGNRQGNLITRHDRSITAVATMTIKGLTFALSGSLDGTARIWNLSEGIEFGQPLMCHDCPGADTVGEMGGDPVGTHPHGIRAVGITEIDGQVIGITGGVDGTVCIWDLCTGDLRRALYGCHQGWVRAIALDNIDGQSVALSGGDDGTINIWDLPDGRPHTAPLVVRNSSVRAVAVARFEGRPLIVSGTDSGELCLWDLRDSCQLGSPVNTKRGMICAIAMGELNGEPIILSGHMGEVMVWKITPCTYNLILIMTIDIGSTVHQVSIDPTSPRIVIATNTGVIVLNIRLR